MKMKRLIFMLIALVMVSLSANAQGKNEKTVVFYANLHCESCKAKVEKNIPFEKGVKDLKVDLEKKTITITFRKDKNTEENLRQAIEKLNIKVQNVVSASGKTQTQVVK